MSHLNRHFTVHVYLDVAALHDPDGRPQSALDLAKVDHALHPHHLQHPVPVVRLAELLVLLRAPGVCPGAPAANSCAESISSGQG